MTQELEVLAQKCIEVCDDQQWKRNWSEGECYLHLEVSEFIEAVRGKGVPHEELGDVFFVLLTLAKEHNVSFDDAFAYMKKRHNIS
jgi:NTP pyrophosphatase (non-canonical NTP hydrolase)